jgi:hypothetical protein
MLSKLSNTLSLRALGVAAALALCPAGVFAQVTPAKSHTPPDDTPSVSVGTVIFTDWTYQDAPKATDADGNSYNPSRFEVTRGYINVTGKLSHLFSFRVTPDIASRLSTAASSTAVGQTIATKASTNYDGNLVFRLKYAFGQLNLDDWLPKGSWVRIGQQQTPYVDFYEHIYDYRFQGTIFPEREGYLTSSDPGLSARIAFPNNYGDVHVGVYNGEGYSHAELNGQKAFQARVALRPLPKHDVLKGLQVVGFMDSDSYQKGDPRDRYIASLTFDQKYLQAGADYLTTKDQVTANTREIKGKGYSFWISPQTKGGAALLFRYDNFEPNESSGGHRKRYIGGLGYWFHIQKGHAALLADMEKVDNDTKLNKANEKRFSIHFLFES